MQEISREHVDYAELDKVLAELEDDADLYTEQRSRGLLYTRRQVAQYEEIASSRDLSELRLFLQDRVGGRNAMWPIVQESGLFEQFVN